MALLFMDGFDCYGTGDITTDVSCRWGRGPTTSVTGVAGKEQGNAMTLGGVTLVSPRFSDLTTLIVGFWYNRSAIGIFNDSVCGFRLSGDDYVDVRIDASDFFIVTRDGTTLGTGTTVIAASTWYFVEFKATIDDTTGSADLNLNGQSEISVSGVDTQAGSDAFVNEFVIKGGGSISNTFDHLYCCDTSGSRLNDFLDQIEIETVKPDAEGSNTAWTPLSGDNFENVDDTAPDGDTTYNETSSTTKDTHNFGDSTHNGIKLAIGNNVVARKTNLGTATLRGVTRTGGLEFDGASVLAYDDYTHGIDFDETNPNTSAIWSQEEIDNAEFGYERVS